MRIKVKNVPSIERWHDVAPMMRRYGWFLSVYCGCLHTVKLYKNDVCTYPLGRQRAEIEINFEDIAL